MKRIVFVLFVVFLISGLDCIDAWAQATVAQSLWTGISALGHVAAPRLRISVVNGQFAVAGFDIVYELGAAVG